MDVRKIFREISKQLHSEFKISSQINHNGNKGDYRENTLNKFLSDGRLPKRFGIGSGEIISTKNDVSKQSDLIVYDQLNSIPLLFNERIQVYPIDCIYGIIEVKSHLSKTKIIEGLENIKSVKKLAPNDFIVKRTLSVTESYPRPKPFGIIFAYSLKNNSLDSLTNNIIEWEKENPPEVWPNMVIVLGEGIIFHTQNGFDKRINSESINSNCIPRNLPYKNDAFFHFYSYVLDLCNNIELPKIEISKYLDLPQQIGKYSVGNNDRLVKKGKNGKIDKSKVYRLNEPIIEKIVTYCKSVGKISQREMYEIQFGQTSKGMNSKQLNYKVYFYNPDNLPGFHQITNAIQVNDNGEAVTKEKMAIPSDYITVDDEVYYYPTAYISDKDYEVIKGKTFDDLQNCY